MNKNPTPCEECENFVLDEETEEYYCEYSASLDEDDVATFSFGKSCPMFRFKDEYRIVRKQN